MSKYSSENVDIVQTDFQSGTDCFDTVYMNTLDLKNIEVFWADSWPEWNTSDTINLKIYNKFV